ncbi:MAG TPA: hypothetical protein VL997_07580, partial [Dyella sp.]|nr:hypothetical protein [Dyella sp.]
MSQDLNITTPTSETAAGKKPSESKCPFNHSATAPTNRDWWPNQLNLKILHQHSALSDPMDKTFN